MLLSKARRLASAARPTAPFPSTAASLFSSTASTSAAAAKETLSGLSSRGGFSLAAKTVLVRADLNVPLDTATAPPTITNDKRIRAVLPTLRHLIDAGARVVVCSHMGRPKGEVHSGLRLADVGVGARLSELLGGHPVQCADDCVGPAVAGAVDGLGAGEVLLLENVRFHAGEEKNDPAFVQALADAVRADVFVNDAFGTAHRAHGTTAGIAAHVDHAVAGFLLDKELQFLQGAVEAPDRPLAAVVGGAKVSTKIPVLQSLLGKCDKILLGGGMIFTFYRAQGLSVGDSLVEEALIPAAAKLIEDAKRAGVDLILPTDVVVASEFKADAPGTVVPVDAIPDGTMGLDIGPDTMDTFHNELAGNGSQDSNGSRTVVWNGPMGVFEFGGDYARGTLHIAESLAELGRNGGTTIVGGGDSVAAVEGSGLGEAMSHVSTGGGASLELLEGKILPGVAALDDAGQ